MPFTTVFCIFINLGLGETINLAKNAVPATRRVNSKPLTGDITLSAADVNAFALGMTGDYTLEKRCLQRSYWRRIQADFAF